MNARFEIVRSNSGWFARFIASNSKEIWRTSEVYTRRRAARRALELVWHQAHPIEIREVDER